MPSPFPGMDPWLEAPDVWPGFHDLAISKTVEVLQPILRPRGYYANPGERIWLGRAGQYARPDVMTLRTEKPARSSEDTNVAVVTPDEPIRVLRASVEVRETYVDIHRTHDHQLVTSIEFVSPTNKSTTKGRRLYLQKQRELRHAGISLIEIDLLRHGRFILDVPVSVAEGLKPWHYLVNLVRAGGDDFELYPIPLRNRLPRIRVPLASGDDDATLDLQDVVTRSYDIGPYPERLNYNQPPEPSLSPEDDAWADQILRNAGLRA